MIPLGILAAQNTGPQGVFELIGTAYSTGSSATITFSGIPSTYKHLQMRMTVRQTGGSLHQRLLMRYNDFSTSTQTFHSTYGVGIDSAQVLTTNTINTNYQYPISAIGGSFEANFFAGAVVDIFNYANTTQGKTTMSLNGFSGDSNGTNLVQLASSYTPDTSAISKIDISATAGTFTSGTRISLYGIRGQ